MSWHAGLRRLFLQAVQKGENTRRQSFRRAVERFTPVEALEQRVLLSAITPVTPLSNAHYDWPSISADGTRIAFQSADDPLGTNADHSTEIFVYDTDTASLTQAR